MPADHHPALRAPAPYRHRHARLLQAMDVTLAFGLLVLLSPVMLVVASLIALESRGASPLYGHRRYGKDGRTFLCYKFKSMAPDADARLARLLASDLAARLEWHRDHKLRDDPRVTRVGRFIRKTSLDELPQLFNVLRGEMSLVGPRPIVAAEVRRYGRHFAHYCSMRPGITGIWQISGRNDTSYRRRVAMDSLMAYRMSPRLYARVLVGTARSVLTGHGAY
ncbi:exopolysaccharide biosynthesis protein [Arthrobacter sp. TPD3018]|uniref:sugar transferase n=1 Tax=Bacteria TaxID=2 RepID=UPI000D514E4A|nr:MULTISPECIES: sugar transferase [Bacteria]PVE53439.1 exopolysaccharide biosynthesis protein [Sphingomonas sp. TPD3009]PVE56123.1 exopolysaccharide biosynthesis protein [Arthrobacter sp. TPD3018]PVE81722.1 exopolysaccharide biosynthesis protein [Sphingomonas melonis]